MRYMIIVKATPESEAGVMPDETLLDTMGRFHKEMEEAGILRDASGLRASAHGWRIGYNGDKRTVVDGPFAETKELIAGYTIIDVNSREEALEWTKQFPNPGVDGGEAQIEVRPFFELEDFGESEAIDRFRELKIASRKAN